MFHLSKDEQLNNGLKIYTLCEMLQNKIRLPSNCLS